MTRTPGSRGSKRVAVYLRVSTAEQTTTNQRRQLHAVAKRHGWSVVQVFEDAGISGAKGRNDRPALIDVEGQNYNFGTRRSRGPGLNLFPPRSAGVDDLLDALACATVARRIHAGRARPFVMRSICRSRSGRRTQP
jgi:Resolvase, N terminal domain/Protein of unknown function (DUF429)